MIEISGLTLQRIAPFQDFRLQLSPGLNIIHGPNESGKSAIFNTLWATLPGQESTVHIAGNEHGSVGVALRIESEGKSWIIDHDFSNRQVRVLRVENERLVEHFAPTTAVGQPDRTSNYEKFIVALTGLSDPDIFSICLHRRESRIWPTEPAAAQIRQLLSGQPTFNGSAVRESLVAQYYALSNINPEGRNRPKPRRIQVLEQDLAAVRKRLDQAEGSQSLLIQIQAQLRSAQQHLSALDEELTLKNKELDALGQYLENEQQLFEITQKHIEFKSENERLLHLRQRRSSLKIDAQAYAAIAELTAEQRQTLRRRYAMQIVARERERRRQTLIESHKAQYKRPLTFIFGLAGGSALAGWTAIKLFPEWSLVILIICCAMVGLSIILGLRHFLVSYRAYQKVKEKVEMLMADRDQALQEAKTLKAGAGFEHLDREDLGKLLKDYDQLENIRHEDAQIMAQIDLLPAAEEMVDALRHFNDKLSDLHGQQQEILLEHPEFQDAQTDHLTPLAARIEALEAARDKTRKECEQIVERLTRRGSQVENLFGWREQLLELENELSRLRLEAEALWSAIGVLDEATSQFLGENFKPLAAQVQAIFNHLNPANKRRVILDHNMRPSLGDETGSYDLDHLSPTTRDQLLLACRLVWLDRLSKAQALPIWIDDAGLGYDDARLAGFASLMREEAQKRQVILSTGDERLIHLAGPGANIIRLPATSI